MKATIYANHGVPGYESQTKYSTTPIDGATLSDKLTVEIPDSLNPYVSVSGDTGIAPDNASPVSLVDALTDAKGRVPAVIYVDSDSRIQIVRLTVVGGGARAKKTYWIDRGDFGNVYTLYWASTPDDIAYAEQLGLERITRKVADSLCASERRARAQEPSSAYYSAPYIYPLRCDPNGEFIADGNLLIEKKEEDA